MTPSILAALRRGHHSRERILLLAVHRATPSPCEATDRIAPSRNRRRSERRDARQPAVREH